MSGIGGEIEIAETHSGKAKLDDAYRQGLIVRTTGHIVHGPGRHRGVIYQHLKPERGGNKGHQFGEDKDRRNAHWAVHNQRREERSRGGAVDGPAGKGESRIRIRIQDLSAAGWNEYLSRRPEALRANVYHAGASLS